MKGLLWMFVSLFCLATMESCQYDSMKYRLSQMYGSKIDLCVSDMSVAMPNEKITDRLKTKGMKLVVYSDTSDCSLCYINHLSLWNDLLTLEDSFPDFSIVFIIEARDGEDYPLKRLLEQSGLRHPVFVDKNGVFRQRNSHLPKETFFHTFLIDGRNEICLVGDPLKNESVEKMLYDALHTENSQP